MPERPHTRQPDPADGMLPVLRFLTYLTRRWRLALLFPLTVGVITVGFTYLIPPTYQAEAAFVPEGPSGAALPGALAGLAGQFGIGIGSGSGDSPEFYVDLIKSRQLLDPLMLSAVPDPRSVGARPTTILELLDAGGRSPADSLYRGLRALRRSISTTADFMSSVVLVRVESRYPQIAALIANRLLEDVGRFNSEIRQSRAGARRRFLEARLEEAAPDLTQVEESIRSFEERNRSWDNSPELRFEHSRLSRQLAVAQEVYLTLRREHEVAQAEEVNDTPVITVIQEAVPPTRKSKPKRALSGVTGAFAGALFVLGMAILDGYRARLRGNPAAEEQLAELRTQLDHSPARLLARGKRPTGRDQDI